ncbi:MAG: LuxR C-terminal-related transcriptional regulator [Planctomycetaceae bacterium]
MNRVTQPSCPPDIHTVSLSDDDWHLIAELRAIEPLRKAALRKLAVLTPRERDVVRLVVAGRLNKAIGTQLEISPKTVEKHRGRMMQKLQVKSLPGLMRLWFQAYPEELLSKDADA